jgi:hypothetical protein
MADEAQNVIVLKDAYDRWAESKGDSADHWVSIFADKIKFGSLAGGEYGAAYLTTYQTREQLAQYFAGIKRDWEMIEYVTENFVAQGDRVVMLGRLLLAQPAHRQGGGNAEGGFLALCRRPGNRVLRVLRHRTVARRDGLTSPLRGFSPGCIRIKHVPVFHD